MIYLKRLISILLVSAMLTSTTAFAVEYGEELKNMPVHTYEERFSDVPKSHWAFNYIAELVNDNVLSGYPDGKFYPSNNVTRAEFAKIMISASGIKATASTSSSFSDVALTDWYSPYVESAKEFLTGYTYGGETMYLPNKAALREDIAVALVKLKGYDVSVADLGMLQTMFSDYESISETAKKYVAVAVERGLVSGYDDGTFKGQQSITRAEAATLIWRANQYGSDNKILGDETSITQKPNTTETEKIQSETTPTPEPEKKPYVMKELASANIGSADFMTKDNSGNIYYIESGCIYKLNTSNGSKNKFMDLSDLSLQKKEENDVVEDYSDYFVSTLVYDLSSDKLYLSGYYKTLTKPYNQPESVTYNVLYDITSGSENVIFEKDLSRNAEPKPFTYATTVNSSTIRLFCYNYETDYNTNTNQSNSVGYSWSPKFWVKYANSIYRVNGTSLQRYNISSREYESLSSDIQGRLAYTKDSVYWYSDDIFHKLTLSDGVVKNLPISLDEANVEYEENAALGGGFNFFVIDDETIIFYDSYMQSFRKLQKNQ